MKWSHFKIIKFDNWQGNLDKYGLSGANIASEDARKITVVMHVRVHNNSISLKAFSTMLAEMVLFFTTLVLRENTAIIEGCQFKNDISLRLGLLITY